MSRPDGRRSARKGIRQDGEDAENFHHPMVERREVSGWRGVEHEVPSGAGGRGEGVCRTDREGARRDRGAGRLKGKEKADICKCRQPHKSGTRTQEQNTTFGL